MRIKIEAVELFSPLDAARSCARSTATIKRPSVVQSRRHVRMKVSFGSMLVINGDTENSEARRRKQNSKGRCKRCHRDKVMMIVVLLLILVLARAHPESFDALLRFVDKLTKLVSLFQ